MAAKDTEIVETSVAHHTSLATPIRQRIAKSLECLEALKHPLLAGIFQDADRRAAENPTGVTARR